MRRRFITPRGIGPQHPLTNVLVEQGLSVRVAHRAVQAIFDSMKMALQRHESVDVPWGTFTVVPQAVRPYRRWWRGRPVEFYRKRYRVVFTPKQDVLEVCDE